MDLEEQPKSEIRVKLELQQQAALQQSVLGKAKQQPGVTSQQLSLCYDLKDPAIPVLYWKSRESDDANDLMKLSSGESDMAHSLIERGLLVATFQEALKPGMQIRLVKHFDDVKWAFDRHDTPIIYDLSLNLAKQRDRAISQNGIHESALAEMFRRVKSNKDMGVSDTSIGLPINLNKKPIRPLILDPDAALLMERQRNFTF